MTVRGLDSSDRTRVVSNLVGVGSDGEGIAITQDATWQVLGGFVTHPTTHFRDVSKAMSQLAGEIQTVGATVELRLVENKASATPALVEISPKVGSPLAYPGLCPDTFGTWVAFGFICSMAPRAGDPASAGNSYRLEGRLNGATSARVRMWGVLVKG